MHTVDKHAPSDPDGIPHAMIAIVAVAALALALAVVALWTVNRVDDVVVTAIGVPLVIAGLVRWSTRLREGGRG